MPKNSYFIDSCIFLGAVIKDENTRACKSFISRIQNEVYIGYISPFVSGEMIIVENLIFQTYSCEYFAYLAPLRCAILFTAEPQSRL